MRDGQILFIRISSTFLKFGPPSRSDIFYGRELPKVQIFDRNNFKRCSPFNDENSYVTKFCLVLFFINNFFYQFYIMFGMNFYPILGSIFWSKMLWIRRRQTLFYYQARQLGWQPEFDARTNLKVSFELNTSANASIWHFPHQNVEKQ